jgi:hypothetical protein
MGKDHRFPRLLFGTAIIANGSLPGVFSFAAEVSLYRTIRGAHSSLVDPRSGCMRDEVIVPLAGHRQRRG